MSLFSRINPFKSAMYNPRDPHVRWWMSLTAPHIFDVPDYFDIWLPGMKRKGTPDTKAEWKQDIQEGLTKDFYNFYEPEIIYSLTQSQFEDLTPTQGIDLTRGDKEHRRFVLPAYYMALQLRYAVDMETMDKSATEALLYWQDKDEHDWRSHAAHILLATYLYMLMNWRKIPEHEIYENYVVTSINTEAFD
ncbi:MULTISPECIES: hypothetical protein [Vibrio]|uniref:Uncharacterized protein n=2 Tax=Vibrio TaxID=662 RepID=A0A7X4RVW2_9VIBR|nr:MULTISPECIES: hypothetical protein [Vibrio]MBF9000864.1 hypothetical protein [Vibrio nitrifigilis]MZI94973.1 hypothetical protein [Vibrio eleionomae]